MNWLCKDLYPTIKFLKRLRDKGVIIDSRNVLEYQEKDGIEMIWIGGWVMMKKE